MRARYLLLVLLGVAMGRADRVWTGQPKWLHDSDTAREIDRLDADINKLVGDTRFKLHPPERGQPSPDRAALLALRADCLAVEQRAWAQADAHPDTITHHYYVLYARARTDLATNLLLWHDLNEIPGDEIPIVGPVATVAEHISATQRRMAFDRSVGDGTSDFPTARW